MDERRVVRTRVAVTDGVWVFGSGYLVAPGRVLTAAHVLAPEEVVPELGSACEVRLWPCGPAQDWTPGRVTWLHDRADVAVVAVEGLGTDVLPVRWGRLTGSEPLAWKAIGFPIAGLDDQDRREEQLYGRVAPLTQASNGGLALTVESRGARTDAAGNSGWAGLSGTAVFSGDLLIGVVVTDPVRWTGSLVGVRTSRLLEDPGLAACTGTTAEQVPVSSHQIPAEAAWPTAGSGLRVVGERISAGVENWRDRDELRAELRAALVGTSPARRILSVTGRRGIGKSATVAKVVAEFERPEPMGSPSVELDGILYLSTRTGVGSLSLARVFEGLTRLLPDPVAAELRRDWEKYGREALPLLWEALRNRRCVVVLDNLDDLQDPVTGQPREPDLVAFLDSVSHTPYPPRVITTSQRALGLPSELSAHVQPLPLEEGLDADDAVGLLRSIADRAVQLQDFSDEELQRATERLCGVPRGIELLAHLLKDDPLVLSDLLESNAPVDQLMLQLVSRAFLGLDTAGRRVVELLALAEVPLPERDVPSILTGLLQPDAARLALRGLVRSRDIGFDARARAVRLHPLDADWVRTRLLDTNPAMQADLDGRLADWYASRQTPPDSWRTLFDVLPHRREFSHRWRAGDHTRAMSVLAEASTFLARKGEAAFLTRAVAAADPLLVGDAARLEVERCRSALEFFSGSLQAAESALRAARAAADRLGLEGIIGGLDAELGTVQRHRGDCDGAVRTLRALLSRDSTTLDHAVRLKAVFELGLTLCYLKDWAGAEEAATQMESVLHPKDPPHLHAWPHDIRALARLGGGDHEGALAAADRAVELYLDSPQQDEAGYIYNVRGVVRLEQDEVALAEEELRRGCDLAAEYRIDRLEGMCATNLAWMLLRQSRWAEARAAAQQASARLASVGMAEAETARIVAELTDSPRPSSDAACDLQRAVQITSANSDFYTPSPGVLTHLIEALSKRTWGVDEGTYS